MYEPSWSRRLITRRWTRWCRWELFDPAGLTLSSSEEIAGKGVAFFYVDVSPRNAAGCRVWVSSSETILRATIRPWRRCVILTAT